MNCQRCRFEIEELETDARLTDEARAHLNACRECRAFHDERQSLKKLIGSLAPVSAPKDFDFQLRARINAAKAAGSHRPAWRALIASAPAIGLAATFALLVAGVLIYKQTRPGNATTSPQGAVASREQATTTDATKNNTDAAPAISKIVDENSVQVKDDNSEERADASRAGKEPRHLTASNKNIVRRRERRLDSQRAPEIVTSEMGVHSAPQILPKGTVPFNAGMNRVVELPVRSASQPMRVFVGERDGAKRRVTLAPVTFGSQDFAGLNPQLPSPQGIW